MQTMKTLLTAATCLCAVLLVSCGGATDAVPAPRYVSVMDAGSSGTRVYLYKIIPGRYPQVDYLADKSFDNLAGTELPEDGIDDFTCPAEGASGNNPANVGPQLITPLLEFLRLELATHRVPVSEVEVNVLATAGMRTAALNCGMPAVEALYGHIRQAITDAGFAANDIRTIDGNREEGVWTWINLNDYFNQTFTTAASKPVGVIEIGGSSLQVSYPTLLPANGDANNVYEVAINGKTIHVFNRTYLGLGLDDARKSMLPLSGAKYCFPTGFLGSDYTADPLTAPLLWTASYDYPTCSANFNAANGYISTKIMANGGDPAIANIAPLNDGFYGINGAYFATNDWGTGGDVNLSPLSLAAKVTELCTPAGSSTSNFDMSKSYAQKQCANATYVSNLLYNSNVGIFKAAPTLMTKTVNSKANGKPVLTWTRGYLLQRKSF